MTSSFNPGGGEPQNTPQAVPERPKTSEFNKRCVALLLDVGVAYFAGILVSFLFGVICAPFPMVSKAVSLPTLMVLYLLIRDFLFSGRGVGKNLVGLQVVDTRFKRPANLRQSVVRNMTWLLPFVIRALVQILGLVIPIVWINRMIFDAVNILGAVYCIVMLPTEAYRAYNRADGLRLGDEMAGTQVVESQMDFSRAIPK
jgi:uncharacterized RDD family membrane protein YckC